MERGISYIKMFDIIKGLLVLSIILTAVSVPARSQAPSDTTVFAGTDTLAVPQEIAYLKGMIDSAQIRIDLKNLPDSALAPVGNLNFRDLDIRDLLRGMGRAYDLNIIVDNNINKRATIRLSDIPVIAAIIHICKEYQLQIIHRGQVFRVRNYVPPQPIPEPVIPEITIHEDGTITLDLKGENLGLVMRTLSQKTGENIIVRNGVSGSLNGFLQQVPFEVGLQTILSNNGFSLRQKDGIYIVDRFLMQASGQASGNRSFWINADENTISLDVVNAPITDVIREIAYQTDLNLITYNLPQETITAKTLNLPLDETLSYLLRGTNFTYRKEDDIYVIGDKNISGIATTKLIRLKHIRADVVLGLIPENIMQGASIQVVKEQNGLMVIGTNDIIFELENFVHEIDYPTPQILIETLVVDINSSDIFELGVTLAKGAAPDSSFLTPIATFGRSIGEVGKGEGLFAQGTGRTLNHYFGVGGNLFGIANLGRLPADFFFRIQALSQEGIVNIRSRPQISTLNGHTASIEIGTTQYFILRTTTPIQSPQNVITQQSERFETIEANVSLEITPWVSASGEVTTEIHPEFNTPVGSFSAEVPPTINSRVLDSTVRLKDGETIILGGLIQDTETENFNKVPILGDIPLIGKLFTNRSTNNTKSELIIFITPHVFYGDGTDAARWDRLREEIQSESMIEY